MRKNEILSAYLFIQKRLLDNSDGKKEINFKEAKQHVCRSKLPQILFPILIREMEKMSMVKVSRGHGNENIIKITNSKWCKLIKKYDSNREYREFKL